MIRNQYILRLSSWFFILLMIVSILPQNAYALTGGPSQPEVQSFSPIGVSDMVDPATGDFSYNIPLLEVGGYPINLSYNAGVTMDQEASTVGLGWNINPGVINRTVTGLPDDFRGDVSSDGERDEIESEFNIRPNWTFGLNTGFDFELFGAKPKKYLDTLVGGLNIRLGIFYNNYKGFGTSLNINPTITGGDLIKSGVDANLGFSLGSNSQSGNSFSASASFSHRVKNDLYKNRYEKAKADYEGSYEAKQLDELIQAKEKLSSNSQASLNLIPNTTVFTPPISFPMKNQSYTANFKLVGEVFGFTPGTKFSGSFSKQSLKSETKESPAYGSLFSHLAVGDKDAVHDFSREKDVPFSKDVVSLALSQKASDVFSVAGQGIGGTYRIKRGDIGLLYDNQFKNTSYGGSVGFELGGGNLLRAGTDIHTNFGNTTTGQWSQDFDVFDHLDFRGNDSNDPNYEPAYFRAIGDKSIMKNDESKWTDSGRKSQVRVKLDDELNVSPLSKFSNGLDINTDIKREDREKRNESISYLSAAEATHIGLQKDILNFPINRGYVDHSDLESLPRITANKKPHHISEITAVRPDGLRYVYGIPAYNLTQVDASFNVGLSLIHISEPTRPY